MWLILDTTYYRIEEKQKIVSNRHYYNLSVENKHDLILLKQVIYFNDGFPYIRELFK